MRKLSEPNVIRSVEQEFLGDRIETEIVYASQFDLLPAWAQWIFLLVGLCLLVVLVLAAIFSR